jgi:hypothetical protein
MVKAGTLTSIEVESFLLLKWIVVPTIISGGVKSAWPSDKGVQLPPTFFYTGVLNLIALPLRTESSSAMIGQPFITFSAQSPPTLTDEDFLHELSSTDLTKVFPSPSVISPAQ